MLGFTVGPLVAFPCTSLTLTVRIALVDVLHDLKLSNSDLVSRSTSWSNCSHFS